MEICSWREEYYDLRGDDEGGIAEMRRNLKRTGAWDSSFKLALLLYRRGQTPEALAATELNRGNLLNDLFRCFLLAEIDGTRERRPGLVSYRGDRERASPNSLPCQCMLRLLGGKEESIAACREWATHPEKMRTLPAAFDRRMIEYFAGLVDEKQLYEAAKDSLNDRCRAIFIAAVKLTEGRRAEAHDHIRRCAATRSLNVPYYDMAKALLPHLDADKNWPKWAPSGK